MKILSPAGNLESLKMAVVNGADEVYLGINQFNARNNIESFDLESLKDAINYAHVFNVKINLAINILFTNSELQNALNIIVDAYNLGVDSFIIQDLGLAKLVYENYPEIEIHASTQMAIHNLEGAKEILKFGFKRIVLARETPLEEIKRIKENLNVELEYFAQGALCVSFSGNCYLSSYLHGASGNRGKCKQLCRLPYTLEKNGKVLKSGYLLSAKDFNMINRLKDLQEAGIDVIKIEGRARRPYYVAKATKEYFNAINGLKVNNENLKLAFNREFTEGYFNGNENIISQYHNHIGVYVGKVEKFIKGKNFNEIYFCSNREISAKSTIKIFTNKKEQITISAFDLKEVGKNKYRVTTTQMVKVGDNVNLIVDAKQETETLLENKKRDVEIEIYARVNEKIKGVIKLENLNIEVFGERLEAASRQPITKEEFEKNFAKSEMFNATLNIKVLENVFMQKQKLNEFRRNVFDKVFEKLTENKNKLNKIKINNNYIIKKFENFEIISDMNNKLNKLNIIYSPEKYDVVDILQFKNKCEKENKVPYLDTPNFALKKDIEILNNIIKKTNISIIANNYYALGFNTNIVIGGGLNVYNNITAEVFNKPIITAESDISTKVDFPFMTLRHCPLKNHLQCSCKNCAWCDDYVYRMQSGKTFKLKRKKLSTCTFYLV